MAMSDNLLALVTLTNVCLFICESSLAVQGLSRQLTSQNCSFHLSYFRILPHYLKLRLHLGWISRSSMTTARTQFMTQNIAHEPWTVNRKLTFIDMVVNISWSEIAVRYILSCLSATWVLVCHTRLHAGWLMAYWYSAGLDLLPVNLLSLVIPLYHLLSFAFFITPHFISLRSFP